MHRPGLAAWRTMIIAPLAALAALPAQAAFAAQPWPTAPAGSGSVEIGNLFWLTFVLAAIVFVLVEALLIYSALRFRRRAPVPVNEPPQVHGNTRLEVMWAIVPALILIGLFGVTVRTMNALASAPPSSMRVEVTGKQFAWDFKYPDANVTTTNELRVPVGQPVVFDVTAQDVIHSFWVPDLHGKIDAIPGRVNQIWFTAERPGSFRGVCAELCGVGHGTMLFRVEAMPADQFQQWLQGQQSGAQQGGVQGGGDLVATGKQLFVSKGCSGCHTLAAVPGATGAVGPKLDGVDTTAANRKPGVSAEAYIKESIQNPTAFVVPGFPPAMPQIPMTDDELAALLALLTAQK